MKKVYFSPLKLWVDAVIETFGNTYVLTFTDTSTLVVVKDKIVAIYNSKADKGWVSYE